MPSDDGVDELIDLITVDAYGDEGHLCFLQAFEDAIQFPIPATLAGMPAMVTGLDFDGNEQRGMVATLDRDGHSATISLLDLEVPASQQTANQLLAAYKRWLGIT